MTQALTQQVGNYDGCLAVAALKCVELECGESIGDPDRIYETLEGIAKTCVNTCMEEDTCLLSPVAAALGINALLTPLGRGILANEIQDAVGISYPEQIGAYAISASNRKPDSNQLPGLVADLSADSVWSDKHNLRPSQTFKTSVAVSAFGHPLPILSAQFGIAQEGSVHGTLERVRSVSSLAISSLGIPDNPDWHVPFIGPSIIKIEVGHKAITLSEKIKGLVISERPSHRRRDDLRGPRLPANAVVVRWPRIRVIHIPINDALIGALNPYP